MLEVRIVNVVVTYCLQRRRDMHLIYVKPNPTHVVQDHPVERNVSFMLLEGRKLYSRQNDECKTESQILCIQLFSHFKNRSPRGS